MLYLLYWLHLINAVFIILVTFDQCCIYVPLNRVYYSRIWRFINKRYYSYNTMSMCCGSFQHHMAQQQQVQLLTNEMDKLRSDNVKLFEKIKFLQSYPTKVGHHFVTA